jgi:hypothetical protein
VRIFLWLGSPLDFNLREAIEAFRAACKNVIDAAKERGAANFPAPCWGRDPPILDEVSPRMVDPAWPETMAHHYT